MARLTQAQIAVLVPEFANADPTEAAAIIDAAEAQISATAFGPMLTYAESMLVGHLYSIIHPALVASGVVIQEAVGQVSASYAAPMLKAGVLSTTRYGREFGRLVGLQGLGIAVL